MEIMIFRTKICIVRIVKEWLIKNHFEFELVVGAPNRRIIVLRSLLLTTTVLFSNNLSSSSSSLCLLSLTTQLF